MGIFEDLFESRARHEKLIAEAEAVGNFEDIVRMGILCAQLGLTPEGLPEVTRFWMLYGD